ncbi:hypothetical protein [Thermogutta sp.]|uniref:hypothetical protein n=1 Tax=Thermogutta sp. TaxID=1962930 RepID=UPI003C7B21F5
MRHFVVLALLCVAVLVVGEGLLSCLTNIGLQEKGAGQDMSDLWRRTKDGWEIAWWLAARPRLYSPVIHPAWLLLAQMMGVVGAYYVHHVRQGRHRRDSTPWTHERPPHGRDAVCEASHFGG